MDARNPAIHRRKLESPNAQIEMPMGNPACTEKEEPSHLAQGTPTSFGWRDTVRLEGHSSRAHTGATGVFSKRSSKDSRCRARIREGETVRANAKKSKDRWPGPR